MTPTQPMKPAESEGVVGAMTITSTRFTSQKAPCGRLQAGERREFRDERGLITDEMLFACGCRKSREEYHDGSVEFDAVRHDGKPLDHTTIGEHGA